MIVGTICRVSKARAKSLKFWKDMKKGMPYLLCPCAITNRFVTLQVEASPGFWIVKTDSSKIQLSAIHEEDLTPRHKL